MLKIFGHQRAASKSSTEMQDLAVDPTVMAFKKPKLDNGMADHIVTHRRGEEFMYAAVTDKKPDGKSILKRLKFFSPDRAVDDCASSLPVIPLLKSTSVFNLIDVPAASDRSNNKRTMKEVIKSKPYYHLKQLQVYFVPTSSVYDSFGTVTIPTKFNSLVTEEDLRALREVHKKGDIMNKLDEGQSEQKKALYAASGFGGAPTGSDNSDIIDDVSNYGSTKGKAVVRVYKSRKSSSAPEKKNFLRVLRENEKETENNSEDDLDEMISSVSKMNLSESNVRRIPDIREEKKDPAKNAKLKEKKIVNWAGNVSVHSIKDESPESEKMSSEEEERRITFMNREDKEDADDTYSIGSVA